MVDSYPEYLNPFAEDVKRKSKLTLRNSFRQLGRNLRQSFRIKKKDEEDVTLRQKTETVRRHPVSYSGPHQEALPRSRFRERISQTGPNSNPFDDEESDKQAKATVRRRGKKRAPLPPKSQSSQHLNVSGSEISGSGSNWSLTSVETEYSTSAYDNEYLDEDTSRNSIMENFVAFNKDMNTLTDDTNNNVVSTEEEKKIDNVKNNIPDIVVSCPSEDTVHTSLSLDEMPEERNNGKESSEVVEDSKTIEENVKSLHLEDEEEKTVQSEEDDTELNVIDITNNLITDENEIDKVINEDDVLYYEKKSLYIAGSRDELNDSNTYTGRVSLFITGSCDDLDGSNNNEVCNKIVTDENSNTDAVPTPKQRKNKLSKNILLGM